MPPIIKFWLCTLKNDESIQSPEFRRLLADVLTQNASFTNPWPRSPPMHAMYQDTRNPSRLLMITGYPSQELNNEADKLYAQNYLARMLEHVQHVWLRQLELDISKVPLEDYVLVTVGQDPAVWVGESGVGGWDVWPQTQQGQNLPELQKQDNGVWVHVSDWNGLNSVAADTSRLEKLYLKKIDSR